MNFQVIWQFLELLLRFTLKYSPRTMKSQGEHAIFALILHTKIIQMMNVEVPCLVLEEISKIMWPKPSLFEQTFLIFKIEIEIEIELITFAIY